MSQSFPSDVPCASTRSISQPTLCLGFRFGPKQLLNVALATIVAGSFFSAAISSANAALLTANERDALATATNPLTAGKARVKRDPVDAVTPSFLRGSRITPEVLDLPGTFVVKFRDSARVRANSALSINGFAPTSAHALVSTSGEDIEDAINTIAAFGGTVRQWINLPAERIEALRERARQHSGFESADLASMIIVEGVSESNFFAAARAMNELEVVEYVSIVRRQSSQQCGDPESNQFCNVPSPQCSSNPSQQPGGTSVPRQDCNPDPGGEDALYGCQDVTCCAQVSEIDPTCNEDVQSGWDYICAGIANLICANGNPPPPATPRPYDACFFSATGLGNINPIFFELYDSLQAGECFVPHGGKGCNQPVCCNDVCSFDPGCCYDTWDLTCATTAASGSFASCTALTTPQDAPTPDFTPQVTQAGVQGFQFYRQSRNRAANLVPVAGVPGKVWAGASLVSNFNGMLGYTGNGFGLEDLNLFQNFMWENYQGGVPGANPFVNGNGVNIAVVDTAAFIGHEEFILSGPASDAAQPWAGPLLTTPQVIIEEGPTQILANDVTLNVSHGTNVLGVIAAADNGFGITGMAHGAQTYFYPSVSVEEGYRGQTAVLKALEELDGGDIICLPWGLAAGAPSVQQFQPLTADAAFAQILALATGLGIMPVLSAGNSGGEIEGTGIAPDVTIVGACTPGNLVEGTLAGGARLAEIDALIGCEANLNSVVVEPARVLSSNFTAEDPQTADQIVHVMGWGRDVMTTGSSVFPNISVAPDAEVRLWIGTNGAPPSNGPGNLQVNRLREYTQNFGGTSAAAAMIAAVAANIQGAAKQFYGLPLAPAQVRNLMRFGNNFDQCPVPAGQIGSYPNLAALGPAILTTDFWDGNQTNMIVHTGGQLIGYAWNNFQIRALDQNYLRLVAQRRNAGQTVAGLTYLTTGLTTDVQATVEVDLLSPTEEVENIGVSAVSRATRNFVLMGLFVKNFDTGRYEMLGVDFINPVPNLYGFDLPDLGNYSPYIKSGTNEIEARVWTVGLGAVGRHQVWHDLIEVRYNQPFNPLP